MTCEFMSVRDDEMTSITRSQISYIGMNISYNFIYFSFIF